MKKAVIPTAIIMLVVTSLLLALVGCGSPKNSTVIDMMKRMPDDTSDFFFENLKKGRAAGAAELCEGYSSYLEAWDETILYIGITPDETDYLAWFISDFPVSLFEGNFNLDNVREKLENFGMNSDEYRGVEIWKEGYSQGAGYESDFIHALVNDRLILVGYQPGIDDCIDVMNGGRVSLWENGDFRDIINRLPDGLSVRCSVDWGREVEDIIVGGFSLAMNDDGTQNFTWVGKFENTEAADNAIDIIMGDLADDYNFDIAIAKAVHDSIYLTITAEAQEIY